MSTELNITPSTEQHPARYCQVKQFGGILAARRHR